MFERSGEHVRTNVDIHLLVVRSVERLARRDVFVILAGVESANTVHSQAKRQE